MARNTLGTSSTCLEALQTSNTSQSVSLQTRSQSMSSLTDKQDKPPTKSVPISCMESNSPDYEVYMEHDPPPREEFRLNKPLPHYDKTRPAPLVHPFEGFYRPPTSCSMMGEQGMVRAASRATLVDQDSGNIYQLIETKQGKGGETLLLQHQSLDYGANHQHLLQHQSLDYGANHQHQLMETNKGKGSETFLLQQKPLDYGTHHQHQPLVRPTLLKGLPGQASIDLGMLQQARANLHHQTSGPCTPLELQSGPCTRTGPMGQEGLGQGEIDLPQPDTSSNIERYIALPLSSTEQYLISSSGQTAYLTSEPPGHHSFANRMAAKPEPGNLIQSLALVHPPPSDYSPPPGAVRLPPLGANSRASSKISLDLLDQETSC